ncbi:metallophosphoesterase domain-containing protein [Dactylonectria macrodidyma]|uniref:Metallophosphoesterase domain-containing protein n=1 Tax=Dactylonectria macrodidyma TaxID=307937 RepID=A0A9P9EK86_9HYPO|nr:metallophosphoesterase domain-containing protein [Dactylonectria macrodidyma]
MFSTLNTYGRPEHEVGLFAKVACVLYHSIRKVQEISDEHAPEPVIYRDPYVKIPPQPITLVCISDTLGRQLPSLPKGDILLHAGNISAYGTFEEVQKQLDWIEQQPHEHKVVIAGSRDLILDEIFSGQNKDDLNWGNIRHVNGYETSIDLLERGRKICIYGASHTPRSDDPEKQQNRAFQYGNDPNQMEDVFWYNYICADTDVVLVHGPPKTHVDGGGKGCERLLAELRRVKPKAVVCGHVHEGRGEETLRWDGPQNWFEGIALGELNPWLCAVKMLWFLLVLVVKLLLGMEPKRDTRKTTRIVNASIACGRRNVEKRDAIVVVI